jgi:cell division protein FtsZ
LDAVGLGLGDALELARVANEKTTFAGAFAMADQVLYSGVACITDLIVKEGLINLDFADVRAVMREMGKAMMGTGEASGENRALTAPPRRRSPIR